MNIDQDEEILKLQRIRTADDKPVVFCIDYLNTNIFPIDIDDDFSHSLFDLLENKYNLKIKYAVTEIIPVTAKEKLMEKLNVKKNSPILLLEQMHFDDQERLFLYSKNYFRSDQFQFKVLRSR
jgi:GntR family transcriptional regulator